MRDITDTLSDIEATRLAKKGVRILALTTALALGYLAIFANPTYSEEQKKRKLPAQQVSVSQQVKEPSTPEEYLEAIYKIMEKRGIKDLELSMNGNMLYIGPEALAKNRITTQVERYREIIYSIDGQNNQLLIYHVKGKPPSASGAMGEVSTVYFLKNTPEDVLKRDAAIKKLFEEAYLVARVTKK